MSGADQITGGAAFPGLGSAVTIPADMMHRAHEIKVRNDGMTLRDYFAAKAMQGLLSSETQAPTEEFAERAYRVADAMLEARKS